MREIKFRIWDTRDKKMLKFTVGILNTLINSFSDGRLIFMQYTGLKDKQNREIYEGDILDYGLWKDEDCAERGVVGYSEKKATYIVSLYSWYGGEGYETLGDEIKDNKAEVIGNIYENFELLEKK